jgi:hypothetical protein
MSASFWPPVPYTPPALSSARKRVVFWYHQSADALAAFSGAFDAYLERLDATSAHQSLDRARADLAIMPDDESLLERLAEAQAAVDALKVEPLGDEVEERARLLGPVLESVEIGGETRMYPTDHADRVAFVRQILPQAVLELIIGIRAQRYNSPGN